MKYKRINIKKYCLISFILILFFVSIFLYKYYINIKNKISKYSKNYYEIELNRIINNSLRDIININNKYSLINIYFKNNEITYIDQNTTASYSFINEITLLINKKLDNQKLIVEVPYNMKQNIIFYNLYPQINVLISNIEIASANIDTKIKNYGINNALIETSIIITFKYTISAGLSDNNNQFDYKYVIDSKVINGKVPTYYGKEIRSASSIFVIPNE